MNKYPLVSAIVCTHDRAEVLPRALDSILAQTLRDPLEVIVIHDGPPDQATKDVCEAYAKKFEEEGVEFNFVSTDEESKYYTVPRNQAMLLARGDYIAHLDDDNAWAPEALQLMVDVLREGLEWPDFVYGQINYVFEEGAPREFKGQQLPEGLAPLQVWDEVALQRLAAGPMTNFVDTSCFMAGRGAYWRLQMATGMMFNESRRRFADWDLITRAVFFAGWRGKGIDARVVDYYWWTKGQVQLTRDANEQVRGEVV